MKPIVTVVIPAYNAEKWVERTLISVSSQSYEALEILVVDDGSRDATSKVVLDYSQKDPRVRLLQQENGGVARARNLGMNSASGDLVAFVDADDLWHPKKIEKQVERITAAGDNAGLAYCWWIHVDEDDIISYVNITSCAVEGNVFGELLKQNFVGNGSTPLIRKSALKAVQGFDTSLFDRGAQGCEDWFTYLAIAEKYDFCVVPEILVGYRVFQGSMSNDPSKMYRSCRLMMDAVRERYPKAKSMTRDGETHILFYLFLRRRRLDWAAFKLLFQILRLDPLFPIRNDKVFRAMAASIQRRLSKPNAQETDKPARTTETMLGTSFNTWATSRANQ